jgi:Kef-type K+ transport system membrane component KefB
VLNTGIIESFFLIFTSAAALATLALYTRQPLLVAYIAVGCILGPHGMKLVADPDLLSEIAEIGIIFLLFLVGLDLQPGKLKNMLGESLLTALGTTAIFMLAGYLMMRAFDFSVTESIVTGVAVTFSSTIIGIKLLPTTVLHHRHIGEVVGSLLLIHDLVAILVLLIQDLVAILALIFIASYGGSLMETLTSLGTVLIALPLLVAGAFLAVRYCILPLIKRFDAFHEFIFLLALGWCLGIASAAHLLGLSFAIGAFVAGVSLATSPIAQYIAESLRPLRDFFLVLFFFSVGAELDIGLLLEVFFPTLLLALLLVAIKPSVFALLLRWQGETGSTAWEVGYRLGQASEFSLLVSYVAVGAALLSEEAANVIQGATVITLVLSSYAVIFRYPSPIAVSARLRRD